MQGEDSSIYSRFLIQGLEIIDYKDGKKIPITFRKINKDSNGTYEMEINGTGEINKINSRLELNITGIRENQKILIDLASRIVTAFRLVREGKIGYSEVWDNTGYVYIEGGLPSRHIEMDKDENLDPENKKKFEEEQLEVNGKTTYCINCDFLPNIADIVRDLGNITELRRIDSILRLALNRFNRSYEASYAEDMLLDLMICLEVLYVGDERRCDLCNQKVDFLGQSILNAIWSFLEKNNEIIGLNQKNVEENIVVAYKLRNDFVHNGERFGHKINKKYGIINVMKFLLDIRDYTRRTLRGYIKELKPEHKMSEKRLKEKMVVIGIPNVVKRFNEKMEEKQKELGKNK